MYIETNYGGQMLKLNGQILPKNVFEKVCFQL
jgi:hypothetical protein